MSVRVLSFTLAAALAATAALAADATGPAGKPVLNRAPSNLIDPVWGTSIRGTAPVGANIITIDRTTLSQAADPDAKPALNRAPSNLNDGIQPRGQAPAGANIISIDRAPIEPAQGQEDVPGYIIFGPPPLSEPESTTTTSTATLPIEVVFFNLRNADCHPRDIAPPELARLQKSKACMDLAREGAQLKLTYKQDAHILSALADGRLR